MRTISDETLEDSLASVRLDADRSRFLVEVKINVIFATMRGNLGLPPHPDSVDLQTTTAKYRAMGAIQ